MSAAVHKKPFGVGQSKQPVLGVDLDALQIRAVLMTPAGEAGWELSGWRIAEVPAQVRWGSGEYVSRLREVLNELSAGHGKVAIYTNMHPDQVRIYPLELPRVKPAQLAQTVYWAVQREEAFDKDSTLFDFEVEALAGDGQAQKQAITAYLVPRADISQLVSLFRQAGHSLAGVGVGLNSLRNLIHGGWLAEDEAPKVFTHVGHSYSRIQVMKGRNTAIIRVIPIGTDNLQAALDEAVRTGSPERVDLRELLASADTGGAKLPEVIESPLDRMARQIDRTVEFYQSSTGSYGSVSEVYLAGSMASSGAMVSYLQGQLTLPIRCLNVFTTGKLEVAEGLAAISVTEQVALSTAVCAALTPAVQGQNFLYTHTDRKHRQISTWMNAGLFALFMVLTIVGVGWFVHERAGLADKRAQYRQLSGQVDAQQPLLDTAGVLGAMLAMRAELPEVTAMIDRKEAAALLLELTLLTPDDIELQHMAVRLGGVASGGPQQMRQIVISGWTAAEGGEARLAAYRGKLTRSALIEDLEPTLQHLSENQAEIYFEWRLVLPTPRREVRP